MAENEISDYVETDNDNTDIAGISVQENVMRPPAVNNAFRALQGALKRWFKTSLFRLRDSTDQTKLLAFDLSAFTTAVTRTFAFPNRSGTVALTSDIDVRRNRIVNSDMRVSQENGTTSGTSNGYYPVDQWAQYRVTSAGTLTVQQVASVTPAGSPNRLRATVTVADAALAAGEYWTLTQNLEGSNVADFRYGSSAAKNSVLRFGFKGPAGTYAVALHNSGATRSYVALFTITSGEANTDTVQTISIAGDQSGTWLTADGVIGITLDIVLACGSTFQGATGWQAGNILGTSAVSNGMASAGAIFELFDVGLKLDPDTTGVYGQYEVGEVHPVYRSERYLPMVRVDGAGAVRPIGTGQCANGISGIFLVGLSQRPAKPITGITASSASHVTVTSAAGASVTCTSLAFSASTSDEVALLFGVSSGLAAGDATVAYLNTTPSFIIFTGARLS